MSELHTLVELGVDRAIFELDRPPTGFGQDDDDPLVTPEGQRWGWLGLAAGAGALAFLSFWVIGSVRSRDDEEPEPEDTSDLDDDAATLSD